MDSNDMGNVNDKTALEMYEEESVKVIQPNKITIQTLVNIRNELMSLSRIPMIDSGDGKMVRYEGAIAIGGSIGFRINRNIALVSTALSIYDRVRSDYIMKHGKPDGGQYMLQDSPEEFKKFADYLKPITDKDAKLPKDIRKLEINNKRQPHWSVGIPPVLYKNLQNVEIVIEDEVEIPKK